MSRSHHDIARAFFNALSAGELPDDLVTPDMTAWTTTRGPSTKAAYQGGVRMLAGLFDGGLHYTVLSLTAEDDRVAAEVRSRGLLRNGVEFENTYAFILRVRDGRVASVAEHFNPAPVDQHIRPMIQAAASKR
ncbi:MAG: nuclear transport factor 2 family protein [Parvularculaceae bacterium]|nr:nuclear transport factor 2 family protein [Parvularculaceae bacterium]